MIPEAYKKGYRWFFEHKFLVNPDVLIPRPATEHLVEFAIEDLKSRQRDLVIDVGTGSGAIIVSIAAHKKIRLNKTSLVATDVSPKALKVAKKNATTILRHVKRKTAIKFVRGNLLASVSKSLRGTENILLLSNLPYLSKEELSEPSIKHEPRLALYGGKDDFALIARLLKQTKKLRISNSKLLLEIGYKQGAKIKKLTKQLWPDSKIQVHKDYSKFDRVAEIDLP